MDVPLQVRVLAYNIRHAQGIGGMISNARIARVIADSDCDVAALTEVWSIRPRFDQPVALAGLTGMQAHFHELNRTLARGSGNAILAWHSVHDIRYIDLGGRHERRGCMLVDVVAPGGAFTLGVVHLSLHRQTRAEQIEQLSDELPRDRPLILAGDFNCARTDLRQLESVLAWPGDEVATYPSPFPFRALDHIGFSAHWHLESFGATRSWASDHLPLIADLSLAV